MTEQQFNKYKELKDRRNTLKYQIKALDDETSINNEPLIECGWIDLSYGNGSFRVCICDNPDTLAKVKDLLLKEQGTELDDIVNQMEKL